MKIIGIYCIKNIVNDKVYIGSSVDIEKRKREHFNDLLKNNHGNIHLQRSYNKYGIEFFEFSILEECKKKSLLEREGFFMGHYKSLARKCGYNIEIATRHFLSEETKQKLREAHLGKKLSDETKKKLSKALMGNTNLAGHKHTKSTKAKISKSLLGNTRTLGYKHTAESKKKMSKDRMGNTNSLGHVASEETKRKMSESHKLRHLKAKQDLAQG